MGDVLYLEKQRITECMTISITVIISQHMSSGQHYTLRVASRAVVQRLW